MSSQIVVAGALIVDAALLVAQRERPPELAGLWELPGGKVGPGESETEALARELDEELGVEVVVGARLGADVVLDGRLVLRAYLVAQTGGSVRAREHRALRWVTVDQLEGLDWVPADRAWLPDLAAALERRQGDIPHTEPRGGPGSDPVDGAGSTRPAWSTARCGRGGDVYRGGSAPSR